MPTQNGVTKSRCGGMSVSLAGQDGRVVGGGLAGLLIAAGPVQVIQISLFLYQLVFTDHWILVVAVDKIILINDIITGLFNRLWLVVSLRVTNKNRSQKSQEMSPQPFSFHPSTPSLVKK